MKKYIITLTLTGLLFFGSCDFLAGPPVYTGVKVGETNAGVVDEAGTVHLLFSFNTTTEERQGVSYIYYAYGDPAAGWNTEIVCDGEGDDVYAEALGIAPDGTIHAVYRYWRTRTIEHAWRNAGGSWESEQVSTVDSGWADIDYGRNSSIATDSTGKVHLTFGREGKPIPFTLGKVYYASVEAGGGTINDATGISTSVTGTVQNDIIIGPDGTIHIFFTGYSSPAARLRYLFSTNGGTDWSDDTGHMVDDTEGSGYSPKAVTDSSGNLQVAYLVDCDDTARLLVKLARHSGGAWTLEEPDPPMYSWDDISHMIAADDTTYILYTEDTEEADYAMYRRLMIASRTPAGEWASSTVMGTEIPED